MKRLRFVLPSLYLLAASVLAVPIAWAETSAIWRVVETAKGQRAVPSLGPGVSRTSEQPDEWRLRLSSDLALLPVGTGIRVPLPRNSSMEGHLDQVSLSASGGRHYQFVFDDIQQSLSLHVGLNATYGHLQTAQGSFVIEPGPKGEMRLRPAPIVDLRNDVIIDDRQPTASRRASPVVRAEGDDEHPDRSLDFLYFYDITMIEDYGWGLADLAASQIANLDMALSRSDVPLSAELTQLQFMDVPRSMPSADLLYESQQLTGIFTHLQTRVDFLGVDIVSLNRRLAEGIDDFCGIAYLLDPTEQTLRTHVNVCHRNGSLVLAHETGHNMGLHHGLETDGSSGLPVDWARGFQIRADYPLPEQGLRRHTVMAYGDYGDAWLPRFSDPTVPCPERGSVCGIPLNPDDPAAGSSAAEALRRYATNAVRGRPRLRLQSSVLPTSRFVTLGQPATAFMTVHNPNQIAGINCIIEHHGPFRDSLTFQVTDAANVPTGEPNQPVTIPANGSRTFIISLTPGETVSNVRFAPYAACDQIPMSRPVYGLNTIDLGADDGQGPDLIALVSTIDRNGIVDIPDGGTGLFAVATLNLGGPGIATVTAQSLDSELSATGQVCQTDAAGACMAPPATSLTLAVAPGQTSTFAVFVRTRHVTPFNPSRRFQFQMRVDDQLRGSTSVAVRDLGQLIPPGITDHRFSLSAHQSATGSMASLASGYFDRFEAVSQPTLGSITLNAATGAYTYTAAAAGTDTFTYRAGNASGWSRTRTATVSVVNLSLPVVYSFTIEEDTEGSFWVDLDDYADENIDIDRFVLTSPPPGSYTFDEVRGVLEIEMPSDPGSLTFGFTAENAAGQGRPAEGRVNVVAYDICNTSTMKISPLRRWIRRLTDVPVSVDGRLSLTEIEEMGSALCLEETYRGDDWIIMSNSIVELYVYVNSIRRYYYINISDTERDFDFRLCKIPGQDRLNPLSEAGADCPLE